MGHARLGMIDGFDFLEHVPGSVLVSDNAVMRFVSGFRVLDQVEGALTLTDLPALDGVSGLDALTQVGELRVERTGLPVLDDLHGIEGVEGDLVVIDNPSLPAAEVDQLVGAIGSGNIGGSVTNQGNGP